MIDEIGGEVKTELLPFAGSESIDFKRLTKCQLDSYLDRLLAEPATSAQAGALQQLLHELQVYQIELEIQNRELRDAQQQLEEARDRYADLYDFAPVGYLSLDNKGNIINVNLRGAALLGRERIRLIGVPLVLFLEAGENRTLFDHLAQVFRSHEKVSGELKLKSGAAASTVVRIKSIAMMVAEGHTPICHSAMIDITEQRQIESALRLGKRRFRAIFEQASVGVALIESSSGRFKLTNQKFSRITGYSNDELQTLDFMQISHPDELAEDLANMQKLLKGEIREFAMEKRLYHKDGFTVWVELTVSPLWSVGEQPDFHIAVFNDISTRKQAKVVLQCHNEVLELLASGAPLDDVLSSLMATFEQVNPNLFCAVLLTVEGLNRSLPYVTPGYWVFINCAGGEVGERPAGDYCQVVAVNYGDAIEAAQLLPGCSACHESATKAGVGSYSSEPILSATGEVLGNFTFHYRGTLTPRPTDQGFIRGAVRLAGIAIEYARDEAQARQHHAELAHMARLNMMGEMATGLAHELNQPLTAISTYADVALRMVSGGIKRPEKLLDALQGVGRQAMRASAIITHLRHMVRKQAPQKSEVDLNALAKEVVGFMQFEARKQNVELLLALDNELPTVVADAIQLEQVLLNLLRNGVEVFKSVTCPIRKVTIRTGCNREGWVEVAVTDTGPGIGADIIGQIFDPFVTTKGEAGMGMGLSICRSIIEAHGGRLWVDSTSGGGAIFSLTLPLAGGQRA
ncbi:MAG: PAS domain S-box protein [Pseudomonadota bacterium]|nr:PAS domain S-box protein [Pseudomonadota bacterium]